MNAKRLSLVTALGAFFFRRPAYFFRWAAGRVAKGYPDVRSSAKFGELRDSLPAAVRTWFDERWQADKPAGFRTVPLRGSVRHDGDILYLGTFKADAHKDLLALKKARPNARITALTLPGTFLPPASFVFDLCDRVVFLRTHAHLVEYVLSSDAKVLVFQGGDDQFALLASCIWPRRLVWQVRDTCLRTPREHLEDLQYERARFIAERSDAIVSFHAEEGWKNLENIRFRSPPVCIPPLCVPAIGPRERHAKLSAKDGALHLIYAGGVGPRNGTTSGKVTYTHAAFYDKFRSIAEQGIHMHVYSPHTDFYSEKYKDYFDLAESSPYFHIEKTLEFEELLDEYTRYDWAIMHVTWQPELLISGFDRPIQNGLMGAIQAQIPILVSPTAYGNAELVETHKRGLVVPEADIARLSRILAERADMPASCLERPLEPELLYDADRFGSIVLPAL